MRRSTRLRTLAPALLVVLATTACSGGDEPVAEPDPSSSPTAGSGGSNEDLGTAARPAVLEAKESLLDWQQVPGSVEDTVTRGGGWSLRVPQSGDRAVLEGPGGSRTITAGAREHVSDALLDGRYAVVVLADDQESRPGRAEVVDLSADADDDQASFTLDGSSDVPTVNGGTWALGGGRLLHATVDDGSYCLASVDLASQRSSLGWCAPERHGFNGARITPAGASMLTFDDSHPACRTVVRLDDAAREVTPFPDVSRCKGWDGLVLEDGAVWSEIPKERRVEEAHVHARAGDGYADLGPAVSGSLTWCGDAAWFARDPQTDKGPAQLLRWSPDDGLSIAYESSGGHAFVDVPRCGGDTITLTALGEGGDEQVSAPAE